MKPFLLILSFVIIAHFGFAQAPAIEWQRSYGSSFIDLHPQIITTADGGYIACGYSYGSDGDVGPNKGMCDLWIAKLSATGIIQWRKSMGGSNMEMQSEIAQTTDGGFAICAQTLSTDGDISGSHGKWDYWVIKLDDTGGVQWKKTFGGAGNDYASSIKQTSDGGYIVAGSSDSSNGDVTGNHGNADIWVIKLSTMGVKQWQRSYGGTDGDYAREITQTADGGYIIAGSTSSNNGDLTGNHGGSDSWLLKISSSGVIEWQKALGGSGDDYAISVKQAQDNSFIVAGSAKSTDGDVTGNHGINDYWVVKVSPSGALQWQKCYGGSLDDQVTSFQLVADGSCVVSGFSMSNDGDVSGNHGFYDYWVTKLSATGALLWQKALGGTADDEPSSIAISADGGYIIAGFSNSYDGDVTGNHGFEDFWIVKLASQVDIKPVSAKKPVALFPNPTNGNVSVKGAGAVNIRARSINGQLVKAASNTDNISLSEFPAGIYFIMLTDENGKMLLADKIIKQ